MFHENGTDVAACYIGFDKCETNRKLFKIFDMLFSYILRLKILTKRTEERDTLRDVSVNGKIIYWEGNMWTELM
jgi:hypothetical protein